MQVAPALGANGGFHIGGCIRPSCAARQSRKAPTAKHNNIAMSDASGPNAPPVRMGGPVRLPRVRLGLIAPPETDIPQMVLSEKFQPKCNPTGIHSRPVMA